MDKQTAIKKIQKCMALAKSNQPHEAAAALRQAQKMMEQFGIEHPELLAAGVEEKWSKSTATKTPPRYEVHLASMVCKAFGCEILFSQQLVKGGFDLAGGYSFIGVAPSSDIAAYTFSVLRRQVSKARAEYIKVALKRHRKNKTAAADIFCEGWVLAAQRQIVAVKRTAEQDQAIDAYQRINHGHVSNTLKPSSRELKKNSDDHWRNGWVEGKAVRVNPGVNANQHVMLK